MTKKLIIDISDDLHMKIKLNATKKGITIKDYVTGLLK